MSSYIVDKMTIDRIISGILQSQIDNEIRDECIMDCSDFGQRLWNMNVNAVDQRYDEITRRNVYEFKKVVVSKIQAYKSLRCLMYQCSEGDVPDSELYKQMDVFGDRMASNIVYDLPAFDQAEWE